jgi:hypothetical protein
MAGYSKRSLVDKLGIEEGHRLAILGAPAGDANILGELPPDVTPAKELRGENDFLHFFT